MKLEFKKGSKYSRKDIGWVCFPDKGRPAGGDWDTGYVRVEDNLIIFMNIIIFIQFDIGPIPNNIILKMFL